MTSCLFCRIVAGEIPSRKVYEDEEIFAFEDINPQAPVHILLIPKRHIATISEVTQQDQALMGKMMLAATRIAHQKGLSENGYRLVVNCNQDGGQVVFHVHFHLLGGRPMAWPPG